MPTLNKLYEELELGYFVVPEIQRGYVWKNSQVLELATSIYKKLPVGAICVCNMPQELVKEYGYLFKPLTEDYKLDDGRYIVIDGRQRLTSLLLIKNGKVKIDGRDKRLDLYFDPRDEKFQPVRARRKLGEGLFKVSDVLRAEDVDEIVDSTNLGDADRRTAKRGLNRLRDVFRTYEVNIINVETEWDKDDLIKVFDKWSEMFVRLNSRGTRVKLPDLVLALITGKTVAGGRESFRGRFNDLIDELSERGYDVDSPPLIRAYLAISTDKVKFREASKQLDSLGPQAYLEYLDKTREAMVKVLDIMRESGVRLDFLQSTYLPVIPAVIIHKKYLEPKKVIDEKFRKELAIWLIHASFDRRYTGRLESDLYQDISTLSNSNYEISAILKNLRTQTLSEDDLSGEYEDRHLTLLSILYALNKARDWDIKSGDPKRIAEIDKITIHHIFPDNVLKRYGYDEEMRNDIANITLISEQANMNIKDREPSKYLRELYEADPILLELHFIPNEEALWRPEKYTDFLHRRRQQILATYQRLLS